MEQVGKSTEPEYPGGVFFQAAILPQARFERPYGLKSSPG
jgi:hypothetical protein